MERKGRGATASMTTVSQASTLTVVLATQLQAVATAAGTTVVVSRYLKRRREINRDFWVEG